MAKGKFSQPRGGNEPVVPAKPPRPTIAQINANRINHKKGVPSENNEPLISAEFMTPVIPPQDAVPVPGDDTLMETLAELEEDTLLQEFGPESAPEPIPAPAPVVPEPAPSVYQAYRPALERMVEEGRQQNYRPGLLNDEIIEDEDAEDSAPDDGNFLTRYSKPILIGLCVMAVILLGSIIALVITSLGGVGGSASDPYNNRILNNISIAGVNVGGMSKSEAISAVKAAVGNSFTKNEMVIQFPDDSIRLTPDKTGADLNIKAAVEKAFSIGRTGTEAEQKQDYESSFLGKREIPLLPYLNLNEEYIRAALETYAGKFSDLFEQSSYTLEGTMPALDTDKFDESAPCQTLILKVGSPGFGLDIEKVFQDVMDAYSRREFRVTVSEMSAQAEPDPLNLDAIYTELFIPPVDSSLDPKTFKTVPGSYGYDFDIEQAKELLIEAKYGNTVRVSMRYLEPDVKDGDVFFRDVLGSCETPHTNNENRNTNLRLACQALDGVVIKPGETFSYNACLGERTAAKGYKPAPAYSGVDVVDSIGGGVCQGSSTLYYCALLADLEIVERANHGFVSSYIDYGMDATVSWGSPDFKFKNNTNFPIKIQAEVSGGKVRMKLLGTDEKDYYIRMEYVVTGTDAPKTVYEEHEAGGQYKDGQVLREGTAGIFVNTFKCKYSKETNKLLSRDFAARSIYKTVDKLVVKIIEDVEWDKKDETEDENPQGQTGSDTGDTGETETGSGTETGGTDNPGSASDGGNTGGDTPAGGQDSGSGGENPGSSFSDGGSTGAGESGGDQGADET